jgi:UDP-glucuronate 4-epimerase
MDRQCPIFVTGAAGFIGFHLVRRLIAEGFEVVSLDSLNDYYDVSIKHARLSMLSSLPGFHFVKGELEDRSVLEHIFRTWRPRRVVNLAAQAGIEHSVNHPGDYISRNIVGFFNILDLSYRNSVEHLVYASSSSVYGANLKQPFNASDPTEHPLSIYAASKKANELLAHSYSATHGLSTTGLRFFTVYGPWGRPDMVLYRFTKAILAGQPIKVFNFGNMKRDFTYVDDIVEGMRRVIDHIPVRNQGWDGLRPDPASSFAPYQVFNIGNNTPVELAEVIRLLEQQLGKEAVRIPLPMRPGEVPATHADVSSLSQAVGFVPNTAMSVGIERYVAWYREYYGDRAATGAHGDKFSKMTAGR